MMPVGVSIARLGGNDTAEYSVVPVETVTSGRIMTLLFDFNMLDRIVVFTHYAMILVYGPVSQLVDV